jgi:hypothetical protein
MKDVRERYLQADGELVDNFKGSALLAVFDAVKGRGRQADLFCKGGIGHVTPAHLQELGQLLFEGVRRRGHTPTMPKSAFRIWNIWLEECF